MLVTVVIVFHVLGLLSTVDAVMNTRTPQGTIAWIAVLNTVPYIAVPAYWVLGRSRFHGYVEARRQLDNPETRERVRQVRERLQPWLAPATSYAESNAATVSDRLVAFPYLTGNSVELLVDGEATFASLLDGIDRAAEYVLFQFFIVHDDEIGREVQRRLLARARAGVKSRCWARQRNWPRSGIWRSGRAASRRAWPRPRAEHLLQVSRGQHDPGHTHQSSTRTAPCSRCSTGRLRFAPRPRPSRPGSCRRAVVSCAR